MVVWSHWPKSQCEFMLVTSSHPDYDAMGWVFVADTTSTRSTPKLLSGLPSVNLCGFSEAPSLLILSRALVTSTWGQLAMNQRPSASDSNSPVLASSSEPNNIWTPTAPAAFLAWIFTPPFLSCSLLPGSVPPLSLSLTFDWLFFLKPCSQKHLAPPHQYIVIFFPQIPRHQRDLVTTHPLVLPPLFFPSARLRSFAFPERERERPLFLPDPFILARNLARIIVFTFPALLPSLNKHPVTLNGHWSRLPPFLLRGWP